MNTKSYSTSSLQVTNVRGQIRLVAFYLPQFHPIRENDEWWGKGFTEWTNVTKAERLYPGHYQPRLPTELGFYDLRVREVRHEQVQLAKSYGIDAFCYHYYWFSGKRLLAAPLEDMLADPDSDMPFCLCWANENWNRRWNGSDQDILIAQDYCPEDPLLFMQDLVPYLTDPRYLKIDGRPLLIVYRPQEIPDVRSVVQDWRRYSRDLGIGELHLCAALTHNNLDYESFGFDSGVEYPPHNRALLGVNCVNSEIYFYRPFRGSAMMMHELATAYLNHPRAGKNIFRGVFPSWDNTARMQHRALFFPDATPKNYEYWLSQAIRLTRQEYPNSDRLVFINAWNEWAEGCHLEPDRKFQRAFLEATLRAKEGQTKLTSFPDRAFPDEINSDSRSLLGDIGDVVQRHIFLFLRRRHDNLKSFLTRHPRIKTLLKTLFKWF